MATIALSSLGSLFGPIGQVVGTLAGSAIDNALFGPDDREGARLKELAVTGSSYGTPIAKQYGSMRVPGTIIWSTDLQEHREKQSNGKGAPKTITYSYSVSFAVALSSRPIEGLGRIWADGNLLRGAGGDLKSAGSLRIHNGHGDQGRDPLMQAALGDQCPAFRGCAYAVFEDLDLTDFGNRIPALSFEVLAGDADSLVEHLMAKEGHDALPGTGFGELAGFSHEGGSLRDVIQLIDRLHPIVPIASGDSLTLASPGSAAEVTPLAAAAAWDEGDYGKQAGYAAARSNSLSNSFAALRYYDPAREYQTGLQHAENNAGNTRTFQFPGALSASDALTLARRANLRAGISRDRLLWRTAELDPSIGPGSLVSVPDRSGLWQVLGWEWRERGIELELLRFRSTSAQSGSADAGTAWSPPDRAASASALRVFETSWDGTGNKESRRIFAAVNAPAGRWSGATLFSSQSGKLSALGLSATQRAVGGTLMEPLQPSTAMRFESEARCNISLLDDGAQLLSTTLESLAQGANRLLVGSEIVQFLGAEPLGSGQWQLEGLLRGRGGTEIEAVAGHAAGTPCTLLDDRLVPLSENSMATAASNFAALGVTDSAPALASLENAGASLRPPEPVHCRKRVTPDGSIRLEWRRRARGQWLWLDEVLQPLVEETEAYEIGYGTVMSPFATWQTDEPELGLDAVVASSLLSTYGPQDFWVRQLGSFAKSRPTRFQPFNA